MTRYPESGIWEEVAYLAYHLHWPLDDLLDLSHRHRVRLIRLVAGVDGKRTTRIGDGQA